ncbi:MAG: hypothetical protein AB7K09_19250 [Planctomycetota bacterium]
MLNRQLVALAAIVASLLLVLSVASAQTAQAQDTPPPTMTDPPVPVAPAPGPATDDDAADADDDDGGKPEDGGGVAPIPVPGSLWPDGMPDPVEPGGGRPNDTLGRWAAAGRGHWPRVVFRKPPFENDDYWVPGGVMRADSPQLFLMPFDFMYVLDGAGQMGARIEGRVIGNAIVSGGLGFWGIVEPGDFGGIFQKSPRVNGVWRLQLDGEFLMWLSPQVSFEIGPNIGLEKDILLVYKQERDIGFYFGLTAKLTAWRFMFRADAMFRIDTVHHLTNDDMRASILLQAEFEAVRFDRFGLVVGYWFSAIEGGPPRNGLSVGLRLWASPGRSRPDWSTRYGTVDDD